jgi:hypothetical protein
MQHNEDKKRSNKLLSTGYIDPICDLYVSFVQTQFDSIGEERQLTKCLRRHISPKAQRQ